MPAGPDGTADRILAPSRTGGMPSPELGAEPAEDEVVAHVLAHHARQAAEPVKPVMPAPGYRSEVLQTLLGTAVLGGGPA